MRNFTITVVDGRGVPLKDVFFKTLTQKFVSGNDGNVKIEYYSVSQPVAISMLGRETIHAEIMDLLRLENAILIIGNGNPFPNKAQETEQKPEPEPEPDDFVPTPDTTGEPIPAPKPSVPAAKEETFIRKNWPWLAMGVIGLIIAKKE